MYRSEWRLTIIESPGVDLSDLLQQADSPLIFT